MINGPTSSFSKTTFLAYILPVPLVNLVEKYLFADWQFLVFLLILLTIDTVLGFVNAWRQGRLDSDDFAKLFAKLISYWVLLILSHVMVNYTVSGTVNPIFGWLSNAIYSSIMVREGLSILKNLGRLNPGLVPDSLLKRLKQFGENETPK